MPKSLTFSAMALIAANLIPLAGVLFYQWDATLVLALFWVENLIIGAFNLVKMLSRVAITKKLGDLFQCGFFVLHYGLFCSVHGTILWDILDLGKLDPSLYFSGANDGFSAIFTEGVTVLLSFVDMFGAVILMGIAALVLSHLVSFIENFILKGDLFKQKINSLMGKPYSRIMIMHVGLILGAFLLQKLGSPIWLLIVIVLFKIVVDLGQHIRRRDKSDQAEMVKDL